MRRADLRRCRGRQGQWHPEFVRYFPRISLCCARRRHAGPVAPCKGPRTRRAHQSGRWTRRDFRPRGRLEGPDFSLRPDACPTSRRHRGRTPDAPAPRSSLPSAPHRRVRRPSQGRRPFSACFPRLQSQAPLTNARAGRYACSVFRAVQEQDRTFTLPSQRPRTRGIRRPFTP